MELAQSGSQADHISAAQYPAGQEVSSSTSRSPTSNYGNPPHSAPSGSFLQSAQRSYYHDNDTKIKDPPIAAPNTTYASYGQNSTHAPSPEMRHSYSYPGGGMYALPRPDWPGYVRNGGAPLTLGPPAYAPNPASTSSQTRPSNGYSFVQVPSVPEKKRTRRRPDQIDRIYKCGWNGCDKAYGTLNHLNAHVTMQSHGQKRVPGEFKKIREEWKQRKKEEAANRKHQGERQHQAATAAAAQNGGCESWEPCVPSYAGLNVPLCPRRYQLGPQQHFIAQKSTYDPHQHSQSCEQPSQFPSSPYDIQRLGVAS